MTKVFFLAVFFAFIGGIAYAENYFAEVKDGIVRRVIVADKKFIASGAVGDPANWIETFTDGRTKNFAGIGWAFDKDTGAFIPPAPYPSWELDKDSARWNAPVARPVPRDGKGTAWDEPSRSWKPAKQ